jgi:hypothetical protein
MFLPVFRSAAALFSILVALTLVAGFCTVAQAEVSFELDFSLSAAPNNPITPLKCSALVGTCEYYSCLSNELKCNSNEYLLSFGKKYCDLFVRDNSSYSLEGQSFLARVRPCLQEALEAEADAVGRSKGFTCTAAATTAPMHHTYCYEAAGYCQLAPNDQALILNAIWLRVLENPAFWRTAIDIELSCL